MKIKPVKLTSKAFKDYGFILHQSGGKPMARNAEITYWGKVSELAMTKRVSTGVLVNHRRPRIVKSMERHVRTPEILVALDGDSVFCVARPSKRGKNIDGIKAFRVKQGDALALHAGAWHWAPFPVGKRESTFLVVFALGTEANDLEVRALPEAVRIVGA